ncbi:unknown [Prevotella sp. CAG:755]|nr:unknown [Prevotella sp. CAG:755]
MEVAVIIGSPRHRGNSFSLTETFIAKVKNLATRCSASTPPW